MRKLFICERPYMLYKTIIKAVLNKNDVIDVVLSNHMNGMEKMKEPLEASKLFNRVYFFDDKLYQEYVNDEHLSDYVKFPKIIVSWPRKLKRYYEFHKKASKAEFPEGLDINNYDEIYVIDGVSTINLKLNFEKRNYIVSEHARNNFQIKIPLHILAVNISKVLDKLNIFVAYSGCSKYVSMIEVTENKNLVSYLKNKKIVEYNLDSQIKMLTAEEKNKIFSIYASAYKVPIYSENMINILLTAPLLEDGLVENYEQMKQCWEKLISKYADEGSFIMIKAHPRDKTDYKKIFPNSIIIDSLITAEVLALSSTLNITKVINLYSSAVAAFEGKCECITLGMDYLKEINK